MALIKSTESEILKKLPDFKLKSTDLSVQSNHSIMGKNGLIILFTCNHCPYASVLWNRTIRDYEFIIKNKFSIVAINPNIHPSYPDDSFENMVSLHQSLSLPYHYLVDETQETAKKYEAQCTPDLFIVNNDMQLIYRGAYDDNWKSEHEVKETYCLNVISAYKKKELVPLKEKSMGCSIKWQ